MILQKKTIEKLRDLINSETEYRSGPQLVSFFNNLGFNDIYGSGFPSRSTYTESRLEQLNGHPEIDKCIKTIFSPVNFINRFSELKNLIVDFNQYLAFDGWQIIIEGKEVKISKCGEFNYDNLYAPDSKKEDDFLKKEFSEVSLDKLELDGTVTEVLESRLNEIKKCMEAGAPLSTIFLCGSLLEGVLLGVALKNKEEFNKAIRAPRDKDQIVKKFHDWNLNNLIEVSCELGFLKEDVRKFSHSLRDFRNYIHPYQQLSSGFNPDPQTAKISWQVLKAALYQLSIKM